MSGAIVGEVLGASAELQARGLSERGFHALVAIAEKAHPHTRQASVRWDHIRAGLFCASLPTAKRAVKDLRDLGLVRVVKRGFDNQHGRVCAPIYEIAPISERITQVSQSPTSERLTQVIHSVGGERINPGGRTDQTGQRTDHLGELLDGSIDGPVDGGARAGEVVAQIDTPSSKQTANAKRPRCARHAHIDNDADVPPCLDCKQARLTSEADADERASREDAARDRIRRIIDNCDHCDAFARLDDLTDCPRHPNFRQSATRRAG